MNMNVQVLFTCTIVFCFANIARSVKWDDSGYVIYCPCMGRFGNQAEHFLGSLGFAKSVNRTLILPPWRTNQNQPFDSFFKVAPLQKYHRVILAADFMRDLAPRYWSAGERVGWCFYINSMSHDYKCEMKKGNPFGPFWDGLSVDFDSYMFFNTSFQLPEQWKSLYPADKYPVIALKGAPAKYPMLEKHVALHQYLQWSTDIDQEADKYIQDNFPGEKFIGIHLRNGADWLKVCENIGNITSFLSSYQCLGFHNKYMIEYNICFPPSDIILSQLKSTVIEAESEVVYISTDNNSMLTEIQESLISLNVKVYHHQPSLPQINLAILGRSHHFIGSCVSSFSAFVSRERKTNNLPSSFWGHKNSIVHTEL